MTEEPPIESAWSRERWFLTISVIFALQVIVAVWLTARGRIEIRRDSNPLRVRSVPADASAALEGLLAVLNPTLYATPNPNGFSGDTWLRAKAMNHVTPGWSDPPQFLQFKPDQLLAELAQFGVTNSPRRSVVADLHGDRDERRVALSDQLKPAPATRVVLAGELTNDDVVLLPEFPVIEFNDVLSPTILSLKVDQRGRVFSVGTVVSSGQAAADQRAVQIVRSMTFTPAAGFSLSRNADDFGHLRTTRLIVHWWTIPPGISNAPAANPPAVQPLP